MYIPKHFEENREEEIKRIIENFPLATLVANTKNGLVANHLPLLLNKVSKNKKVLIGHIAKTNNLHRDLNDNDKVMAIFKSEDSYISPNWYPSRNKNREHVPTWNYQAIHLHGNIAFNYDQKFLLKTVEELTKVFEKDDTKEESWKINKVSTKFMSTMIKEIVGITITITSQIAKSKLSQNRDKEDRKNVTKELKNNGYNFLYNSMKTLK